MHSKNSDHIINFLTSTGGSPQAGSKSLGLYLGNCLEWFQPRLERNPGLLLFPENLPVHDARYAEPADECIKLFFVLAGCNEVTLPDTCLHLPCASIGVVPNRIFHSEVWQPDQHGFYLHLFVGVYANRLSINLAGTGGMDGLPKPKAIYNAVNLPFQYGALLKQLLELRMQEHHLPQALQTVIMDLLLRGVRRSDSIFASSLIMRCTELILQNPTSADLSVKTLAQQLNCHPDYLSRRFHQERREGIMDYVRRLRMEIARDILSGMTPTIADLATICGYRDHSYFTKTFRETFGTSPSAFARQIKPDQSSSS